MSLTPNLKIFLLLSSSQFCVHHKNCTHNMWFASKDVKTYVVEKYDRLAVHKHLRTNAHLRLVYRNGKSSFTIFLTCVAYTKKRVRLMWEFSALLINIVWLNWEKINQWSCFVFVFLNAERIWCPDQSSLWVKIKEELRFFKQIATLNLPLLILTAQSEAWPTTISYQSAAMIYELPSLNCNFCLTAEQAPQEREPLVCLCMLECRKL